MKSLSRHCATPTPSTTQARRGTLFGIDPRGTQLRARSRCLRHLACNRSATHANPHDTPDRRTRTVAQAARRAEAGRHAERAHRRGHQRLRRGRAALRPVARRDRRARWATASGPSRSSRPRSGRRRAASPARAATASGSASGASPTAATRPIWWSRSTSRCCSAACAPASSSRRDDPAREHVARAPRSDDRGSYVETYEQLVAAGYQVHEIPMEQECRSARGRSAARQEHVRARHAVQHLQPRPAARARADRAHLRQEGRQRSSTPTSRCSTPATLGRSATSTSSTAFPPSASTEPQIVVNGNTALALGVLASGMDICAMYPITPATSASHYLSECSRRSAASCTRPRTRSPPARSRSAPPTPASAR